MAALVVFFAGDFPTRTAGVRAFPAAAFFVATFRAGACFAAAFPVTAFLAEAFDAVFFAAVFFVAGFFVAVFFDAVFFDAVFFEADFLDAVFFAAGFFAAGFFDAVFFAGAFEVADRPEVFFAAFFAFVLLARFIAIPSSPRSGPRCGRWRRRYQPGHSDPVIAATATALRTRATSASRGSRRPPSAPSAG
ncbi:hypothetical protein [Luteimonas pelagia]